MSLSSLDELFTSCRARFDKNRIAFQFNDQRVDWGTLGAKTDAAAGFLAALGLRPGAGAGWTLPNRPELLYLLLGASRIGIYTVPLFHMIPDTVKAGIFAQSRVQVVITTGAQVAGLREARDRLGASFRIVATEAADGADAVLDLERAPAPPPATPLPPHLPLLMATSSGTTGMPKPVMMTRSNVAAVLHATAAMARTGSLDPERGVRSVLAFPLSTSGVLVTSGMLLAGVELVFSHDMSPFTYLGLAAQTRAEVLSAPPAYFEAILGLPPQATQAAGAVRCIMTGMDFLSPSLLSRLRGRFPELSCAACGYGLVETSTIFMLWQAHDVQALSGNPSRLSVVPDLGNEVEVRGEDGASLPDGAQGELWVRGPCVVSGYLGGGDEAQAAFVDGWFRTGDVAVREDAQTITLLGRRKHLIKRGGRSVSPVEVKGCIEALQGVRAASVVGVPHPLYGEMIWAFVVLAPDADLGLKEIMRHCREQLASYMVPDQVTFIDAIPRHPGVGKENLDALVERARAELAALEPGSGAAG